MKNSGWHLGGAQSMLVTDVVISVFEVWKFEFF